MATEEGAAASHKCRAVIEQPQPHPLPAATQHELPLLQAQTWHLHTEQQLWRNMPTQCAAAHPWREQSGRWARPHGSAAAWAPPSRRLRQHPWALRSRCGGPRGRSCPQRPRCERWQHPAPGSPQPSPLQWVPAPPPPLPQTGGAHAAQLPGRSASESGSPRWAASGLPTPPAARPVSPTAPGRRWPALPSGCTRALLC